MPFCEWSGLQCLHHVGGIVLPQVVRYIGQANCWPNGACSWDEHEKWASFGHRQNGVALWGGLVPVGRFLEATEADDRENPCPLPRQAWRACGPFGTPFSWTLILGRRIKVNRLLDTDFDTVTMWQQLLINFAFTTVAKRVNRSNISDGNASTFLADSSSKAGAFSTTSEPAFFDFFATGTGRTYSRL